METLRILVGELAWPPVLLTTAAVVFLAAVRSPWPWTRFGGALLALAATAAAAAVLWKAPLRHLVLAPERLPVAILLLGSGAALWLALHQAHGATPAEEEDTSRGFTRGELLAAGFAVVLVAVLAFTIGAPLAEIADPERPPEPFSAPWFLLGLAEVGVFFDPWVSALLLPAVFLAGLVALPYFDISPEAPRLDFAERREVVIFFLAVVFLLVLFPMASGTFLRGARGEPAAPFSTWRSAELVVPQALSERMWGLVTTQPPRSLWLRELPPAVLLVLYFVLPPLVLPRWGPTKAVFGRYQTHLGHRRFAGAMVFALALGLVPLKMYLRSIFAIAYFFDLPELGFGF